MATAFSNVAADNVLEGCRALGLQCVRIGRPAAVRPALWPSTLVRATDALMKLVCSAFDHTVAVGTCLVSAGMPPVSTRALLSIKLQ